MRCGGAGDHGPRSPAACSGGCGATGLEGALHAVVGRHEALRTRFPLLDGQPVQVVEPAVRAGIPLVDLTSLRPEAREPRVRRLMADEAARPFDLASGPVHRALLYRLDEREHCLLLVVHHLAADAWSQRVLAEDLAAAYGALARGEEPRLPEPPLQPGDVAAWQRRELDTPAMRAHLDFWRARLACEPPHLELPAYRPRPWGYRPAFPQAAGINPFILRAAFKFRSPPTGSRRTRRSC